MGRGGGLLLKNFNLQSGGLLKEGGVLIYWSVSGDVTGTTHCYTNHTTRSCYFSAGQWERLYFPQEAIELVFGKFRANGCILRYGVQTGAVLEQRSETKIHPFNIYDSTLFFIKHNV